MNAETTRTKTDADIQRELRDFARQYDVNRSGTIEDPERVKMLRHAHLAIVREVENAVKKDPNAPEADWTDADIENEAIKRVDQEIQSYEFSVKNVGRLGQPKPAPYGTGPDVPVTDTTTVPKGPAFNPSPASQPDTQASTYEEAVQKINAQITDPVRRQAALAAAKQFFGVH
jgi:hypothetical protein